MLNRSNGAPRRSRATSTRGKRSAAEVDAATLAHVEAADAEVGAYLTVLAERSLRMRRASTRASRAANGSRSPACRWP